MTCILWILFAGAALAQTASTPPQSVDRTGGIPDFKETQDYVEGIVKKMR